jgi:hypothetical protein
LDSEKPLALALEHSKIAVEAIDQAVLGIKKSYDADGLISFHGTDFLQDRRFQKAYSAGISPSGANLHLEWRAKVALWAASIAIRLDGDFVECGVNTAILSGAIVEYLDWAKYPLRKFYLLDSFSGIPSEGLSEKSSKFSRRYKNIYVDVYEEVRAHFSRFSNVQIVKGVIPNTLAQVKSEKIVYLSIDLNVPEPEIAAGEYLWPKLVVGAPIVLDDYNYQGYERSRQGQG